MLIFTATLTATPSASVDLGSFTCPKAARAAWNAHRANPEYKYILARDEQGGLVMDAKCAGHPHY